MIERPDDMTQVREQRRRELYRQHPEYGSPDTPFDQIPEGTRAAVMQYDGGLAQRDQARAGQGASFVTCAAIVERANPRGLSGG